MQYSVTIAGLVAAVGLPLLGQWGFSEACSQELLGVGVPYLLSLPGIVVAYFGRLKHGDIKISGFKK